MDINLDYYKIFYYVGILKSISKAAEQLAISQPAVSQSIKQLEKAIGAPLFIRTSKGVRFTSEGEVLFSYIKRGYEYITLGENKVKEMLNLQYGEIRIGASDMTLQFYLLPILEQFHEQYPKIKVTVTNGPTPETLNILQEGRIDFGVVSSPIVHRSGIQIRAVKEIEDSFVAGSKFRYLKDKKLEYSQLETLPIICLEGNTSTRTYVDAYLLNRNVVLNPEFELATSEIIVQFALRNLGIASVVRDFARKYIENGELIELKFNEVIPKRNFCIAMDENNPLSSAAQKFMDMISN
ncbi:DNA-binding transcriptional LysR family regulator [Lachnotalea glycerini]|jgi:DNA-binding transcriptional LysR family regulator|uniref:DNA-binding transcriptional LysR family regulator n=1 Tax=Lachnotalea glycerini TaxID=1763509 RepID=A0A255IJX8_9FIRM|nr:LysR family transcriptional regulator [Lachnotalea glycerini]PXV89474.1 DNA-binding transcriptional LysR family regulator [Lachnotalea glycerini]RDY32340.1 LysR family transcriptional regulator [Lachnotalea glycerini]